VLLEVRGNAEAFNSIATSLPQILGCADSKLIHTLFQQRQKSLMTTSTLLKKSLMVAASVGCVAVGTLSSTSVFAATFNGSLINGQTQTGTVAPGDNTSNPNGWSFWQFLGNAGDSTTLTVRRLVGELDPAFGVWFGTESNISNYLSIFSSSANTQLVASADDNLFQQSLDPLVILKRLLPLVKLEFIRLPLAPSHRAPRLILFHIQLL
jgi:hypothetical protein